jgi:hypothetical protein
MLRKIFHSMSLREYLIKSNSWLQVTIDQIWWDVHAKAIKKLSFSRKKFIIKYIHNRLPYNSRQNKYYSYKDSICKICRKETETQDHFLTCTGCSNSNKMRKDYLYNFKIQLENNRTTQEIQQLIYQNMSNCLNQCPIINVKTIAPDASVALIRANNQQMAIGWEQWFKGRLSREWGALKNFEIKSRITPIKHATSEKWAVDMILLTWNFIFDLWIQRNKYEHDETGNPILRKKDKLIEIIRGESKKKLQII